MSTYNFRNQQRAAALPDAYLFPYLVSFIEEAYECEAREAAHRTAPDRLESIARGIVGELVQTLPTNPNLLRAAKKYRVTKQTVMLVLKEANLGQPERPDGAHGFTDRDSIQAMGAALDGDLSRSFSTRYAMAKADTHSGRPLPVHRPEPANVFRQMVKAAPFDPARALQARKAMQLRTMWPERQPAAVAVTVDSNCPVHNGRDISKAQNLHNPFTPCTCGAEPNPYG